MTRGWRAAGLACAMGVVGGPFVAAESWSGVVSDSACGATHEAAAEGADKMPDRDCTLACVKGGSKFVLVSAGKVYAITNQDFPGLAASAGRAVTVDGDLKGDAIVVARISRQ